MYIYIYINTSVYLRAGHRQVAPTEFNVHFGWKPEREAEGKGREPKRREEQRRGEGKRRERRREGKRTEGKRTEGRRGTRTRGDQKRVFEQPWNRMPNHELAFGDFPGHELNLGSLHEAEKFQGLWQGTITHH